MQLENVIALRVAERAFAQTDAIMGHLHVAYGLAPAGTELARLLPGLECEFNHQVIATLAPRICGYATLARASSLPGNITRVESALRSELLRSIGPAAALLAPGWQRP